MNIKNNKGEFDVLRKLDIGPKLSQRGLAKELGFSVGKMNYCLKALKQKGWIKIKNFSQ